MSEYKSLEYLLHRTEEPRDENQANLSGLISDIWDMLEVDNVWNLISENPSVNPNGVANFNLYLGQLANTPLHPVERLALLRTSFVVRSRLPNWYKLRDASVIALEDHPDYKAGKLLRGLLEPSPFG